MIIEEIFVDSDGVVADFDGYVLEKFGRRVSDFNPKSKFWSTITHHDANVEKFFLSLPKMNDADILMAYLLTLGIPHKILTACGYTPRDAKEQKIEWYGINYPTVECIVVPKSGDKAQYAHPKAVLIDDREKSIGPWRAAGGIGILHTSAEDTIAQLTSMLQYNL